MKRTIALLVSLALAVSLASVALAGCTYKNSAGIRDASGANAASPDAATVSGSHWYYFSDSGIHAAASPQEIPARNFRPWTEAVRVADSCVIDGSPVLLINRLGIMTAGTENGGAALHRDEGLFPSYTAGGLYRSEGNTLVRLYRNSFFSDGAASTSCLARFDGNSGSFTPLLASADFGLSATAQCVALDRIGSMWYASFKDEKDGKVDFTYLEFPAIPASGGKGVEGTRRVSKDDYQKSVTPFPFKDAPESIATLLAPIPEGTAFSLKVRSESADAAQTFVRDGSGTPVEGSAFVSRKGTAALFADGTFYFRPADSGKAASVLRLPTLSRGYVYTDFVLAGKKILAAWEEQRFFETGRAGILEISIPDEVY